MIDSFLYIALPYLAIVVCVIGSIYRIRSRSFTYSALSSQFLESKSLIWGSLPWHIGITVILLAHIVAFLCPSCWQNLMSHSQVLLAVESTGIALSIVSLLGLLVLLVRRVTSPKIQSVTTTMDLVILFLLIFQVALGLDMAMRVHWGAFWAAGTTSPYVWSILTLQPDASYVAEMPLSVRAHILCAWLIVLLIPFSRLIHIFAAPFDYLLREPEIVVWTNPRRIESATETYEAQESKRHFVTGLWLIAAGAFLFSLGTVQNIFKFFFGPRLSQKEEEEIMEIRLKRLQATAEQRKLELEREASDYILVAPLSELTKTTGKYFIDYEMHAALAFVDDDGLPNLLSAKCTHLGCTVGNQVNGEGKIECPCHVSYFDIHTGVPSAGSPAKEPLPLLGWVLMDRQGKVLASQSPAGKRTGNVSADSLKEANVYIAKKDKEATT